MCLYVGSLRPKHFLQGLIMDQFDCQKMVVRASRKRKEFGLPCVFSDKDAMETFSSGMMECRPFKDPSYDKEFAEQDIGIQSIPVMVDVSAQTMQGISRNNAVQYHPCAFEEELLKDAMMSEGLHMFLKSVKERYIYALQQNEVVDILEDDFSRLAEEEDHSGQKSITVVTEYQSFSDLMYSKGKMVT
eukprot:c47177_g1_i1 orf=151-714(+)